MGGWPWAETEHGLRQLLSFVLIYDEDGVEFYFINNKTMDKGHADGPWRAGDGMRRVDVKEMKYCDRGRVQVTISHVFPENSSLVL